MPKAPRDEKTQRANPMSKQLIANKTFGQNFLKNPGILDKIMDAADTKSTDIAFEIGPGTGNLTSRLLKQAKMVIAQEIDPRMVAAVQKRAQAEGSAHNLTMRQGDCLKCDWPPFTVCVANLPYQISSPFTFKLLAHKGWRCAVIMFQKEFAERLVAQPGENFYGRLALNCRLFAKVTRVCKVDRGSFNPPPKVDSMVVKFTPVDVPIDVDFREWDGMMRICFSRKRKTLAASFKTRSVLRLLETNFRTFCALKGINNPEQLVTEEVEQRRQKKAETVSESSTTAKNDDANEDDSDISDIETGDVEMGGSSGSVEKHQKRSSKWDKIFQEYCVTVLEDQELDKKRAIALDVNVFLGLLLAFNKKGIHFSNITDKKQAGFMDAKNADEFEKWWKEFNVGDDAMDL